MARPKKEGIPPAKSRIYVVDMADGTKRLVKAISRQQATIHVAMSLIKGVQSGALLTETMIAAVQSGVTVEDATSVEEMVEEAPAAPQKSLYG